MESEFIKINGDVHEIVINPTGREFHKRIRNSEYNKLRFTLPVANNEPVERFSIVEAFNITHKKLVDKLRPRMHTSDADDEEEYIYGSVKYLVKEECYVVNTSSIHAGPTDSEKKMLEKSDRFNRALMNRDVKYYNPEMLKGDGILAD